MSISSRFFQSFLGALVVCLAVQVPAQASLILNQGGPTAQVTDVKAYDSNNNFLGNATLASGSYSGNDATGSGQPLLGALNDGLFGNDTWTFLGKSDEADFGPFSSNPNSTWGFLVLDDPIDGPVALSLKAATNFSVYFFDESFTDIKSFKFKTDGTALNPQGQPQDLSHASLFAVLGNGEPGEPGDPVIPEPTSLLVWSVIGLGVYAMGRRLRRKELEAQDS